MPPAHPLAQQSPPSAQARTSCHRCHKRKKRCDRNLPQCDNCRAALVACSFLDDDRQLASYPIAFVQGLEARVKDLEQQLAAARMMMMMGQGNSQSNAPQPDEISSSHQGLAGQQQPPLQQDEQQQQQQQQQVDPFAEFDPILLDIAQQQQQDRPQTSLADELKTLSLQATAERHLGSSSGISFARLTQTVLRRLTPDKADFVFENVLEDMSPSTLLAAAFPMTTGPGSPSTTFPQPLFGNISLADITDTGISLASLPLPDEAHIRHLVDFYFAHTHTLYPFLARGEFHNVLARAVTAPDDPIAQSPLSLFKIWMVLAIGSTTYSAVTLAEESESVLYYSKALEYLEAALGYGDMAALEVIMLQVCYSFFNQLGPNTWFLVGLAARLAMGIGLHSASTYEDLPYAAVQAKQRLFWSIYCMDRLVSTALGRPFAIHDDDIDVEPFDDVDDDEDDTSGTTRQRDPLKPSNMAVPLHILRLRRIASKTTRLVYSPRLSTTSSQDTSSPTFQRLNCPPLSSPPPSSMPDREAIIQSLHHDLLAWRRAMPFPLPDTHAQVPHLSSTWFDLNYYTHLAILYRPSPLLPVPSADRVATLAEAASMAIRQAASMHRQRRFAYNWLNLLSVYTNVLSLVYATTARPESLGVVLAKGSAIEDLGLAVELLGTLAAKFPAAGKIKRMVEEIAARYESLRSAAIAAEGMGVGGVAGGVAGEEGGMTDGMQTQHRPSSSSGQI